MIARPARSGWGGVRLERSLPQGQIRIVNADTGRLAAELYHHGQRAVTLRLRPGRYQLIRLRDRRAWSSPGYPAERVPLNVSSGVIALDRHTLTDDIVLVPEGSGERGSFPPGLELVPISAHEELSIVNSPFRTAPAPSSLGLPPVWSFSLRIDHPYLGPDLSGEGGARPGGAVRMARSWPISSWNRLAIAAGAALEYGVTDQGALWASPTLRLDDTVRHELRATGSSELIWLAPGWHAGLEAGFGYAPGLLTSSASFVKDSSRPEGARRYLFVRNVVVEAAVSIRVPAGRRWEVGPVVRLEGLRFALDPDARDWTGIARWVAQVSAGVVLRQSAFGGP
jgi:hypothetical protein